MRPRTGLLTLVLTIVLEITAAQAAGMRLIEIAAQDGLPALNGAVWYPCPSATPVETKFGPSTLMAVQDCPVTGDHLALIVISHGAGGWFGAHHDTAEALADAGFLVAAINHPLDSGRSPTRRPGDIMSMIERPADLKRLVDYMLSDWPDASRIDADKIGAFGFSRGGFTGLVAAGGTPNLKLVLNNCPTYPGNHWCEQIREGSVLSQSFTHDSRVKALVVADPAMGREFTADGLKGVTIPVQLWGSERGGDGVFPRDLEAVNRDLPVEPDFRIVPNSHHFDFMAPCTAAFAKAAGDFGEPEVCADAAGFDRAAFHQQFNAAIIQFFRDHLHG